MRRSIILCTLLLAAVVSVANPVGKERATKVAKNAVTRFCFEMHGLDAKQPVELTDVSSSLGFDLLHIYQYRYGEVNGFIVISGDDMADPVLAFSDEGELDLSGTFDRLHPYKNPAFINQLVHYSNEISYGQQTKAKAPAHVARKWKMLEEEYEADKGDFFNDRINPLLGQMVWGQGRPYNNKCPRNSVTGCVATAFGMIMNYWDYPQHGFGSHSYNGEDNPAAYPNWTYGELSADFENTYYDWEHMEDYAFINSPSEVIEAISTLLYQIGVSLDMRYSPDGSGCWSLPEYAMFDTSLHLSPTMGAQYRIPKHFGYKYSYAGLRDSIGDDTAWMQMLYQSLAEGKPIYYAGWASADNEVGFSNTNGHGYIIDGYFSDIVDSNLFHINWGWDGVANSYFKLDAMRPQNNDYTKWHGAIIGLEPDTTYHGYDPAGIAPVQESLGKVFVQNGHIVVRQAAGQAINVYDVMGRRVAGNRHTADSEWTAKVHPGIYVVRIGQSPAQKVIVLDR